MSATPSLRSPHVRSGSPAPGCSTLMTSAPNSPNAVPAIGPAASVAASTTRRPWSGPRADASGTGAHRWSGKTEVVAQRRARVLVAEHTPPLELGHDEANHVFVRPGNVRRRDHEPFARVAVEPLLHLVGDVCRRTDETRSLQQRGAVPRQVRERDGVADVLTQVVHEPVDPRHRLDEL